MWSTFQVLPALEVGLVAASVISGPSLWFLLRFPCPLVRGRVETGARAAPRKICTVKLSHGGCPGEHSLISETESPENRVLPLPL